MGRVEVVGLKDAWGGRSRAKDTEGREVAWRTVTQITAGNGEF